MNLFIIFGSVILCGYLARVDSVYYLEQIEELDRDGSGSIGGQEERVDVVLYECNTSEDYEGSFEHELDNICNQIDKGTQQHAEIYAIATFNAVKNLELLPNHSMYEDKNVITGQLPNAVALGIIPRAFPKLNFQPTRDDDIRDEIRQCLARFPDTLEGKPLSQYLLVNDPTWLFYERSAKPARLFAGYAAVLRKVVEASGYLEKNKSKLPPMKNGSFKSLKSFSKSVSRSFSWFRSQSRSQTKFQSGFQCPSPSKKDTTQVFEKSAPRSKFPSSLDTQLKDDIKCAVQFLAFKMIDPCFVLHQETQGSSICTTYSQFIGMANDVTGLIYPARCTNLNFGQCVDRVCKCLTPSRVKSHEAKNVNMEYCNNAFRLQNYRRATDIANKFIREKSKSK